MLIIVRRRVGTDWSSPAAARRQHEARRIVGIAFEKQNVRTGSIQKRCNNRRKGRRAVVPEDSLFLNATCNFQTGLLLNRPQDLVQAGIIRTDIQFAVNIGDLRRMCTAGRLNADDGRAGNRGGHRIIRGQGGWLRRRECLRVQTRQRKHCRERANGYADSESKVAHSQHLYNGTGNTEGR